MGQKIFGGATLKTSEAMEFLKRRMSLNPVRNTKLIGITVYSEDKNEAALLANKIAEAYRDYRLNIRNSRPWVASRCWKTNFKLKNSRSKSSSRMWTSCARN